MIHIAQSSLTQITEIFDKRKKAIGLGKYSVGELLDHGGMSNIYRIIDSSGNTDYVLRISEEHKSSYSNDIFNVREMEILDELKKNSQPHVVQYLDAFTVDIPGQPRYYCSVMKFLSTLRKYRLNGDGVEIAVRLGCDFLPLLQSFTEKEIIHRDIKPENIFYNKDFRNDTGFLLGDFGIAKRDTESTATATGTETTMAPEVRGLDRSLGKDRTYSDMYSLGIVMYRYLNQGVYPSNRERIDRIPPDTNPFPEPRYGSRRLKDLVVKATSYHPADRFNSPQAMLRELQQCDEYRKYILNENYNENATVNASESIVEEIQRLRRELDEREKQHNAQLAAQQAQIEQLEQQVTQYKEKTMVNTQSQAFQKPAPNPHSQTSASFNAYPVNYQLPHQPAAFYPPAFSQNPQQPTFFFPPAVSQTPQQPTNISEAPLKSSSRHTKSHKFDIDSTNQILFFNPGNQTNLKKQLSVGKTIYFGKYPQEADGEILPLLWRVLGINDGKVLLITEKLIDYWNYHNKSNKLSWSSSALRKWMNNDFMKKAFGTTYLPYIVPVINKSKDKNGSIMQTTDKIFALDIFSAKKYFASDTERIAYITAYANAKSGNGNNGEWWWLRSLGNYPGNAAYVDDKGKIDIEGDYVLRADIAVRPALWLNVG